MAHWTNQLTTRQIAEQLLGMVELPDDPLVDCDGGDDAEILDAMQAFVDRLDDSVNHELVATLNVYVVPFWNGNACALTHPHLRLISAELTKWLEVN